MEAVRNRAKRVVPTVEFLFRRGLIRLDEYADAIAEATIKTFPR